MAASQQPPADLSLNKYSLEYSFEELRRATRGFDPQHQLGKGAFGAVYHGTQEDGTEVAIKVIDVPEGGGFEEEVRVLSKFRHPNLVILMGFARCGSQRILVYELLAGGDMYKRLARSNSEGDAAPFSWRQRASAVYDAACGLSHLHRSKPKAFHRDIKSANILLDRNGTAKMADFGLACLSHTKTYKVEQASGTVGYACPLYAKRGIVTEGSEVYSFGIVLLEILTASPPAWIEYTPGGMREYKFLVSHIRNDLCTALSLADPKAHWPLQISCAVADLALRCTQMDEELRPEFAEVVTLLRPLVDAPDSEVLLRVPMLTPFAAKGAAQEPPWRLQMGAAQPAMVQPALQWAPEERKQIWAEVQQVMKPAIQPAIGGLAHEPLLWSLECTFAESTSGLAGMPREQRTIVHCQEPGGPLLIPLKVGRLAHEDFLRAMLHIDENRAVVSREHFQIWAVEMSGQMGHAGMHIPVGGVSCAFYLANLGRNWTTVNGTLLDACGKYVRLHEGDLIHLGRNTPTAEGLRYTAFIQLRFDLTGSVLRDSLEDCEEFVCKADEAFSGGAAGVGPAGGGA